MAAVLVAVALEATPSLEPTQLHPSLRVRSHVDHSPVARPVLSSRPAAGIPGTLIILAAICESAPEDSEITASDSAVDGVTDTILTGGGIPIRPMIRTSKTRSVSRTR